MNFYDLHDDPKSLHGYDRADAEVAEVIWDRYKDNHVELKKREAAIAKSAQYSYLYAMDVLCAPFPAGESAIAKDAGWSYFYAMHVLKG